MRLASTRHLFNCSNAVFQPNNDNGVVQRESNSVKKLQCGGARFTYVKTVLGWVVNSFMNTIHLTASQTHKPSP